MTLRERVLALLAEDGRLGARWPRYERRDAQLALAADIADTFERGGVRLAEAPTGIGKSLAYLVPAVLAALGGAERVVIATCTRSLQDQLVERDLPAVLEALGERVPFARLKGKQNYLCPRALDMVAGEGAEEEEALEALRRWAAADAEGDLDRFDGADPEAFRRVRGRVATDTAACTLGTCGRGRECFWVRARRQAAAARIVVVNHALLALAGEVEGLVPRSDLLVVDEAHRLEGVLLAQLERGVSRHRLEELLRLLGTGRGRGARAPGGRGAGGLLARVRARSLALLGGDAAEDTIADLDALAARAGAARDGVDRLFSLLAAAGARAEAERDEAESPARGRYAPRRRYRSALELLGRDLGPLEHVLGDCDALARGLARLAQRLTPAGAPAGADDDLAAELDELAGRFTGVRLDLEDLADAAQPDWVYWWSADRGRGDRAARAAPAAVELHGSPVSVGDHARRLVLERARATVLTSATLAAGGDFAFLAERLGLGESRGAPYEAARYPTPFPLAEQVRAFVYEGTGDEAASVATVVEALARATGRSQLVLFTAHERLRRARERLAAALPGDVTLLAQDQDGTAAIVSERFRARRGAILLGVQSLWEGVDFPGEALEILVLAKLPFSVPDDPRVEARGERLRAQGLDPFRDDAVPEAVLRFRQGVGRLIRRADDRGIVVVCDPRLRTATYRRPFLEALPVAPVRAVDAGALAQAAAAFLAAGPAPAAGADAGGPPARVEEPA